MHNVYLFNGKQQFLLKLKCQCIKSTESKIYQYVWLKQCYRWKLH